MPRKKYFIEFSSFLSFAVGIVMGMISIFLPWYSYKIIFNQNVFSWVFYPFENWTDSEGYEHTPPDMSSLTPFFYIEIFYGAIVLSILLVYLNIKNVSKNIEKSIEYMMYFGTAISAFLFIYFVGLTISNSYYFPYLQIDAFIENYKQTRIYSISSGTITNFFANGILIFSVSIMRRPTLTSIYEEIESEQNYRSKDEIPLNSNDNFTEPVDLLDPNEEYQQIEDKFVEKKNNFLAAQYKERKSR